MALHPNNVQARRDAVEARRNQVLTAQSGANDGKSSLIGWLHYLEARGHVSQARKLGRIIARLEAWQNGKP